MAMMILVAAILLAPFHVYAQDIAVQEWVVPTPNSLPHDIVVDRNGVAWFTEINSNKIGMFDPETEKFLEFDIPTPSSRPHGLVPHEDGSIWFTQQAASKLGRLDPSTGEIEEYDTPTRNSGPHTPIMGNGVLWFTEQAASKIGRLDIATGTIDEFPTPTPMSSPYGIILDHDGNPWYAALSGHRIGKVDADKGEITEYQPPTAGSGTRRIAIDSEGKLWFTEYNAAKIGSFDPRTEEFEEYDTISRSSGPYAIWVDIYDNVWFSMTGAHKVGKFDQITGTLREYDMPSPNTTIRFIYADSEGNVWFANDNNKIGVIAQQDAPAPATLKIVYIDVGQGSSNLIAFPNGKTMLIDGGERHASTSILEELQKNGVERLDIVVATHPHADHIGGLINVINSVDVDLVVDSGQIHTTQTFEDLLDAIEARGIPLWSAREGDILPELDASVGLQVLNPPTTLPDGADDEDEFNNNSVAIKLTYRNFTALFTGDTEEENESRLAGMNIDADVLTAGHHGSRTSNTASFLQAVSPEVVVISLGAGNQYGHPHQEALDRIEAAGAEHIFRTDLDGTVTLTTAGDGSYTLETSRSEKTVVVPEFSAAILVASVALISIIAISGRRRIWKSSGQA
jgi:beta-lactamase superfamily II metal-dependent hydrolase/sugar lactone lactonase YvrE